MDFENNNIQVELLLKYRVRLKNLNLQGFNSSEYFKTIFIDLFIHPIEYENFVN